MHSLLSPRAARRTPRTPSPAALRFASLLLLCALAPTAAAQTSDSAASGRESAQARLFRTIPWTKGPAKATLGTAASIQVPAGCAFTGARGSRTFMELTENPPSGDETGVLLCEDPADTAGQFWMLFSWDSSGYVKDTDGASLDADAILKSLRDGTDEGNKERQERGWSPITIAGWDRAPYYDPATHNLTWATLVRGDSGETTINHSVRLLGRAGVMHADLIISPRQKASTMPVFDKVIGGFVYLPGQRYSEWREGDKVAEYGLTALIAGGAGVAAVKLGLFGKLWKLVATAFVALWKLIAVAVAAVATKVKSIFRRRPKAAPANVDPAP